jgi:methylated-DNA-protein-cysteine methyltransferase related protein
MTRSDILERMILIMRDLPKGRVLSYGRLAELAGAPGQSRLAAWFCRHLPEASLPWHRVLSVDGKSRIPDDALRKEQFHRLWDEDVPFRNAEQVDMSLALWDPRFDADVDGGF